MSKRQLSKTLNVGREMSERASGAAICVPSLSGLWVLSFSLVPNKSYSLVFFVCNVIIGSQGMGSRTGHLRAGPMGGVNRVGHWESGSTPGYVRAQRGRARSALFSRVCIYCSNLAVSSEKVTSRRNRHQTFDVKRQGHHRQLPIEGNGFFHPNNILREEWELPLHRPQV